MKGILNDNYFTNEITFIHIVTTVSKDVAKAIQAGRQKLGITQKDLAQVMELIHIFIH